MVLGSYTDVLRSLDDLVFVKREPLTRREMIEDACRPLFVSDEQLRQMMSSMEQSMEKGLGKETAPTAVIKMLPSFVRSVPNGSEEGHFLALDLGGTNFRVLLIKLHGREAEMTGKIFRVPENVMRGSGEALFDHIADCMARFMDEHGVKSAEHLPLGFTFSFPCAQDGLTKARLINWTKGFSASGVEGADVVTMLREACARRKDISVDVVAVLNDTVGTLMACAFKENNCQIGVIVGTGTNACYMEKISRIPKLAGQVSLDDGMPDEMIINTEWGAFGDDGALDFLRCDFDRNVDARSINRGKQLFEKMISGMYLGEIVREILHSLSLQGLLFDDGFDPISHPGCFPTKYISEIESDVIDDADRSFEKTRQILEDIGIDSASTADCAHVAYVCSLVSTRAAHLTAAAIACLLNRMSRPSVTVGLDGSVYRFHPSFPRLLDQKIDVLVKGNIEYQLMLSEDGSGRGAALVAAVATRMKNEKKMSQSQ